MHVGRADPAGGGQLCAGGQIPEVRSPGSQRKPALGGGRGSLRRETSTCNQCGSHRKRRKPTVGKVPHAQAASKEGDMHEPHRGEQERCAAEGQAWGLGGWEVR